MIVHSSAGQSPMINLDLDFVSKLIGVVAGILLIIPGRWLGSNRYNSWQSAGSWQNSVWEALQTDLETCKANWVAVSVRTYNTGANMASLVDIIVSPRVLVLCTINAEINPFQMETSQVYYFWSGLATEVAPKLSPNRTSRQLLLKGKRENSRSIRGPVNALLWRITLACVSNAFPNQSVQHSVL